MTRLGRTCGISSRWPLVRLGPERTKQPMSERGAEVQARLATMNELDEVLGAMRGMAAARIQQGERAQAAAREYADRIGAAFASLTGQARSDLPGDPPGQEGEVLVVALCTERGFVGALNERTLRAATETPPPCQICIVGARASAGARAGTDRHVHRKHGQPPRRHR